ncbi:putative ribonuclease H-like domain-containing protein [Tanacetum coccineum]
MAISSSSSSSSSDNKVVKERDELKLKIEKWEGSSKNLTKILNSQMSTHDKNGLWFGTQMDDLSNKSETDSENSLTIFEVRSSDEESTLENNRFIKANEYHAVPFPITGSPLNPRADISFVGLDEYAIRNKFIESKTLETTETLGNTNDENAEKSKFVNEKVVSKTGFNRDEVIVEDWTLDDEDDVCDVQTDHAVVDSGFSSHMTGNKAYLSEYEDFNGGFVAFGSDPKGDELNFNLFSVSQMCDKKNSVLFTKSECLILSPNFKLLDETDESKLWHMRLGHVNFKNINKLVKGHLVRGLPLKVFVNNHTCVAFKKGKQHKASCKAKLERIIRKPLELLHMDLFGHVSIESINKKRNGFKKGFSCRLELQKQNVVAERKTDLIEAARTMESKQSLGCSCSKLEEVKTHDIDDDPLVSLVRESMKEKSTDFGVSKEKSTDKGKRCRRRARSIAKKLHTGLEFEEEINTGREEINTCIEEVSTGSTKVDSGTASERGQREGKASMVEGGYPVSYSQKTKDKRKQKEAGLEEAIKAKLEANAELSKYVLGQDLPEQDFAKRMVDMVNQRKKYFAEERVKAKRNKPITQSQLRIYMSNYLKNQGTWKLSQLKKLKFEENKEEFDKYGEELQTNTSKKQRFDDKDVPAVGEKVVEVKEEEQSAQEDSETDKEESVEAMNPTPLTTKSDSVAN